jgi:hypothetical protein
MGDLTIVGLALGLVLKGLVKARGLILMAPFLPDVESLLPALEAYSVPGLRVIWLPATTISTV